jgi:hypothetical protein
MSFGLVFPSFPALVLAIGLFGKIMIAGTGTDVNNNTGKAILIHALNGCFGT